MKDFKKFNLNKATPTEATDHTKAMKPEVKKIELDNILLAIYLNDKSKSHYGLTISQRNDIKNLVHQIEQERDGLKEKLHIALGFGDLCKSQQQELQALKDAFKNNVERLLLITRLFEGNFEKLPVEFRIKLSGLIEEMALEFKALIK